jgi:transcriptional regulator with XRE-family HTH domain
MTEKAARLGISQSYYSQIYNGVKRPGWKLADKWKPITKRTFEWWKKAESDEIRALLDRL